MPNLIIEGADAWVAVVLALIGVQKVAEILVHFFDKCFFDRCKKTDE